MKFLFKVSRVSKRNLFLSEPSPEIHDRSARRGIDESSGSADRRLVDRRVDRDLVREVREGYPEAGRLHTKDRQAQRVAEGEVRGRLRICWL